jgi:hypothetical protein
MYQCHEVVVLAAVPSSEADDVEEFRMDGVVKRARLVVEQFGGIYRKSRDRRGVV